MRLRSPSGWLDGQVDVINGGRIALGINDIEVVNLMRTKFCFCQKDNVVGISEAALDEHITNKV